MNRTMPRRVDRGSLYATPAWMSSRHLSLTPYVRMNYVWRADGEADRTVTSQYTVEFNEQLLNKPPEWSMEGFSIGEMK